MTARLCKQAIVVFCLVDPVSRAETIHVDANAPGTVQNGTSWCEAYLDLQEALAVAGVGDEIRIADGVYLPDGGSGDRAATFHLVRGAAIFGGYAGCGAADPGARDPALFETILSGDLNGDDGAKFTNYGDNSYHVVSNLDPAVDQATVLDGVTVRAGNANGTLADKTDQGPGLHNHWGMPDFTGRPLVNNCRFEDNWAANHGAVNDHGGMTLTNCVLERNHAGFWGGALYIHHELEPTVDNCQFIDNTTDGELGGGGAVTVESDVAFTDCLFSGNYSDERGGAVYVHGGANVTLDGCTFSGNSAWESAGALYVNVGSADFTACDFHDNHAVGTEGNTNGSGGAVWASMATFTECTFIGNSAQRYSGAVRAQTTTMRSCLFKGNSADVGGGFQSFSGVGLFVDCDFDDNEAQAGGGCSFLGSAVTLVNCRFRRNSAHTGAGMTASAEVTHVINCLFRGNVASGDGGGIQYVNPAGATESHVLNVYQSTFAGNDDGNIGGSSIYTKDFAESHGQVNISNSILWDGVLAVQQDPLGWSMITLAHSNIQGNWIAYGPGNIDADPGFVDLYGPDDIPLTDDDDLRLLATSPCVDSGLDSLLPADLADLDGDDDPDEALPLDLDDAIRTTGGNVDMGAYEAPFIDSDGDGVADAFDQCPGFDDSVDTDDDTVADGCDNCPEHANSAQGDCDEDGIGDVCALASGGADVDCNNNNVPDSCDIDSGAFTDGDANGILDICEVCPFLSDCADGDMNGVRDDGCVWWGCGSGGCAAVDIHFGDMGGQFGLCAVDGAVDGNDRFHALNCFANTHPGGGEYPCEHARPAALNVDAGGAFGSCAPDGVCDGNDAFHALNAFSGESSCSCPLDGEPAPEMPDEPRKRAR